jgi:hypothetical protein
VGVQLDHQISVGVTEGEDGRQELEAGISGFGTGGRVLPEGIPEAEI